MRVKIELRMRKIERVEEKQAVRMRSKLTCGLTSHLGLPEAEPRRAAFTTSATTSLCASSSSCCIGDSWKQQTAQSGVIGETPMVHSSLPLA